MFFSQRNKDELSIGTCNNKQEKTQQNDNQAEDKYIMKQNNNRQKDGGTGKSVIHDIAIILLFRKTTFKIKL